MILLLFSSIIFFIDASKDQATILIFPSKYWISASCDRKKKKVEDQNALSINLDLLDCELQKKIIKPDLNKSVVTDKKNIIATGIP